MYIVIDYKGCSCKKLPYIYILSHLIVVSTQLYKNKLQVLFLLSLSVTPTDLILLKNLILMPCSLSLIVISLCGSATNINNCQIN